MRIIYLASDGCDENTGLVPEAPLRSLARAAEIIADGDTVRLRGGERFEGNVHISGKTGITVESYGIGLACIAAGDNTALYFENCSEVTVCRLRLEGMGYRVLNRSCGLKLDRVDTAKVLTVEACGFHKNGISVDGCTDVLVYGCFAHDNGATGIHTAAMDGRSCERVTISHCRVYDNAGDLENRKNHSGSGIVIAGTRKAVVEYCDAAGNGWGQRQTYVNGPVGIWCCCGAEDVLFQYNIARYNRTQPGAVDGDGIDIDGEVSGSVTRYNYTYGNEGSGYLLCEFYGDSCDTLWENNRLQYNVSVNDDTRVPDYGALRMSSPDGVPFTGAYVEKNLFVAAPGLSCVYNQLMPDSAEKIEITGNCFVTGGESAITDMEHSGTVIRDNDCYAGSKLRDNLADTPLLTEPRDLIKQPIFNMLENGKPNITADNLFFSVCTPPKAEGFLLMELQMNGPDYEGTEKNGNVSLTYDSLRPGTVTRLTGAGSAVHAPLPWWEMEKKYVLRATARLQSPDVKACLFHIDEHGIEHRRYFNRSCASYSFVELPFTGNDKWFDPGQYVGVRVTRGTGSLLLYSVEFVELDADSTYAPADSGEFRQWGDVYRVGESWELNGGAQIERTEDMPEGYIRLEINCTVHSGNGLAYICSPENEETVALHDGCNSLSIKTVGGSVTMGIAQAGIGKLSIYSWEMYHG